jgi:hydroxymethylbilane synthase
MIVTEHPIRIGTRGSALARWQAEFVKQQLTGLCPDAKVDIVEIRTQGDIITDVALASLPGKAFFTKEIEEALLNNEVDLAVHSGKDVPTELPQGLELAGFLKRHLPSDAWLCRSKETLDRLPRGSRVGTSSSRRRALLANLRPDLDIRDLRGNVDTRLRKLDEEQYDAIVLAAAGLERLGLIDRMSELLDVRRFPPAVSQGAMALEIRQNDDRVRAAISPLVDADTTLAVTAERALLRALEGGCQVPLGALATVDGEALHLIGTLLAPDGSIRIDSEHCGDRSDAEQIGLRVADDLRKRGGDRILERIRAND